MRLPKMTEFAHYLITQIVQVGDIVIDATCGNGHDTLFLAELVGESGQVYAFDIQQEAIELTAKRLTTAKLVDRVTLIHASHADLLEHIAAPVKCVLFNLGYLPGGNKEITTILETSMVAIQRALELLQTGGLLVIVVYPGHEAGKVERESIDPWTASLDEHTYQVVKLQYYNQSDTAPYVLAIHRR